MIEPTPLRLSVRTALIMAVFALVFTALMAGTYLLTQPAIQKSVETEKLKLINEILPPDSYDNNLLQDVVTLGPTPELGLAEGGQIWRARKNGQVTAVVIESVAPDGYGGQIKLIIAVRAEGSVSGVRATAHKETPGLGDYIDPRKDRDKTHPWIEQFVNKSLSNTPKAKWKVRKDGGDFAYMTGATISARAVTQAVGRVVLYTQDHHAELLTP